jgi:hypothetical protein
MEEFEAGSGVTMVDDLLGLLKPQASQREATNGVGRGYPKLAIPYISQVEWEAMEPGTV